MNKDIFYVTYYDFIDQPKVQALMTVLSNIVAQEKPKTLYFLISSGGGDVNAGITLYEFLNALPVEIVMHNIGTIDSIATVIFMAGDKRYTVDHGTFLFHGVAWNSPAQPMSFSLSQMKEITDSLDKMQDKIAKIMCSRTKMGEEEIKNLFASGENKNTGYSLEKGIVHEAKPAQIPQNAPFITLNFNTNK